LVAELKEPVVKVQHQNTEAIGIDLGLKDFATLSNGTKIEAQRTVSSIRTKISIAQRANKKNALKRYMPKSEIREKNFIIN
jgi:putative transposase